MPKVKENCGVVGIYSLSGKNVVPMVFDALRALQHRGQEAWGFAVPNKTPFKISCTDNPLNFFLIKALLLNLKICSS